MKISETAESIGEVDSVADVDVDVDKIVDWYAGVTQFLVWPVILIFCKIFLNVSMEGRKSLKQVRRPFIIVSNHISFYDSFLFSLIMGPFSRHLPLRFMAVEKFNWRFLNFLESIGIIRLLYLLFGVFTVVPGRGIDENLKKPINILRNGGVVVVYPEGRIVTDGTIAPFKRGAAVLHRKTGATVLPVCFISGKGFIRKKVIIKVGSPISILSGMSEDETTQSLRNLLINLRNKNAN